MKKKNLNLLLLVTFFIVLAIVNILAFSYMYVGLSEDFMSARAVTNSEDIPEVKEYKTPEWKTMTLECEDCSDNRLDLSECRDLFDSKDVKVHKVNKYMRDGVVYCSFSYLS